MTKKILLIGGICLALAVGAVVCLFVAFFVSMGYDPNSRVTFVTWTNLPISVEGKWTSMALVLKIWDQIYVVSPLTAFPSSTATP